MSREAIPGTLNLVLTAAAVSAASGLLRVASHTESWSWRIAAAVAFSFVANTIFSLLHEAVHGVFHPRRGVNEAFGRLTAAFFPTGLGFQRICHLGHHHAPETRIRLEILFSLLVQAALWKALDLSLAGWGTCYAAFALNWSSLQYADHAWSGRDVHDGAWNLRVSRVVRYFFLNYHHHKAHHQHPTVPWLHLPRYVDTSEERPSFLSIYLRMWLGPRPWPGDPT